jgi:hypothetical protein
VKTVTLFGRVLAVVAVLGVLTAPIVSAQKLDGLWFKLKLAAKGETLDKNTSNVVQKATFNAPVYAKFVTAGANTYTVHYWTDVDAGWTNLASISVSGIGTNNTFLSDVALTFNGLHGDSVHAYHTVFVSTKLNSSGVVKSATYNGVGEINVGTIIDNDVTNFFFGGCSVTGSTIATNKLPSGVTP